MECRSIDQHGYSGAISIFSRDFRNLKIPKAQRLFSARGARIDALGWVEVTPENFALEIAERIRRWIRHEGSCEILEVCSGLGGNTAAFARRGLRVTAVEIDQNRVRKAAHNCGIYGIRSAESSVMGWANREAGVRLITADFLNLPVFGQFDCVFISPPWGGVNAIEQRFRLQQEQASPAASLTVEMARKAARFADRLVLYLPNSLTIQDVEWLSESLGFTKQVAVQVLTVEGKAKACVVYMSRLKADAGVTPSLLRNSMAGTLLRKMIFHSPFLLHAEAAAQGFSPLP